MLTLLFAVLFTVLFAVIAYGTYKMYLWAETHRRAAFTAIGGYISAFVAMLTSSPAFASGTTINFDLEPFFTSLNEYLPVFIGLFGLIAGIVAAMGFAKYIMGVISNALSGKGGL